MILLLLLTACAQKRNAVLDTDTGQVVLLSTEEQNTQIREQVNSCNEFFGLKSSDAEKKATRSWWLMVAGLVSGSIVAPALTAANAAANAPWISAFSGASGASVVAVGNADNLGIGPRSTLQGIVAVATAIKDDRITAMDTNKPFAERSAAASRVQDACENPYAVAGYVNAIDAEKQAALLQQIKDQQAALIEQVHKLQEAQDAK